MALEQLSDVVQRCVSIFVLYLPVFRLHSPWKYNFISEYYYKQTELCQLLNTFLMN